MLDNRTRTHVWPSGFLARLDKIIVVNQSDRSPPNSKRSLIETAARNGQKHLAEYSQRMSWYPLLSVKACLSRYTRVHVGKLWGDRIRENFCVTFDHWSFCGLQRKQFGYYYMSIGRLILWLNKRLPLVLPFFVGLGISLTFFLTNVWPTSFIA